MLTTTYLRTSKTAKIKKVILLYCCTLTLWKKNKHTRTAHVAAVVFAFADDFHQLFHNLFT